MSSPTNTLGQEARALWSLAWPMVLAQLGFMTMGLVDTLAVGHVSEAALSSVALANTWSFAFLIFGMGMLRGLDPHFSQAHGANQPQKVAIVLGRALVLAAAMTGPLMLMHWLAEPGLRALAQPAASLPLAGDYAQMISFSILPMMIFLAISQLFQNLGKPRAPMVVVAIGNLLNGLLNWVLVFGVEALSIKPMGALGTAWATLSVRWAMCLTLIVIGWPLLKQYMPQDWRPLRAPQPHLKLWAQALPVGFQSALESWAFTAMALMVGSFGQEAVAAHAIAMNMAALSFMVVLGISSAAAARVGHLIGAGLPWSRSGWLAISMGAAWMSCSALIIFTFPAHIASLFTYEQAVIATAATLLPVAASFQLFDGVQAVAFGVLRGAGDTRWPALANIFGYWLLGLPLAYFFGYKAAYGPVTIWRCVALALVVVSAILILRLKVIIRRGGARVVTEE